MSSMKVYKVGGAVRDKLLKIANKDCDWVVTGSTPQEMLRLGYQSVGKDFPVFLHPKTKEEYALARTEKKIGKGYKGFTFYSASNVSLEADLARRDLTINAIAEDETGQLIDPYHGREDLNKKILRHVSPAFVEDPLRVLRVARFAACFGFHIAPETILLMQKMAISGELETLSPERVWGELEAALRAAYPARFILALRACNALAVLFPELDKLFGIPQPAAHHPEIDTGIHTLMTLVQAARLSDDPQVRFAALLHDLGKGTSRKDTLPAHHGHEVRGVKLIEKLCSRYRAPNQFQELAVQVSRYHLDCHRIMKMRPETILKKLEALDAFRRPQRFAQFLLCCEADARGRRGFSNLDYPQKKYFYEAYEISKCVDMRMLLEQGYQGESLGRQIRQERIKAISGWITTERACLP